MHAHHFIRALVALGLVGLIGACTSPQSLPAGITPIPTLIPVTEQASPGDTASATSFNIQSYPVQLPSAGRGQPLYEARCAQCHGEDGSGVIPGARNFNDLDYMRGASPAAFYTLITEGRGEMPPFRDELSSDERWDVVFYVWRFSTDAQTLELGQQIYTANCAACHGEEGNGELLGSADFTDLRQVEALAPRDFYLTVTQGRGSMPAWQGRLSQDERWAVIDYLRTFSYDPAHSDEASEAPEESGVACDPQFASQTNLYAWDDANVIAAGQTIYEQYCVACHGADGSGAIPNAPDFTSPDVQRALLENSGAALCVLAVGQESMPGWQETLSIEQMWQVLTFLASLAQ